MPGQGRKVQHVVGCKRSNTRSNMYMAMMVAGTDDGMLGVMNSSPCFYWLFSGFLPLCKAGSKEISKFTDDF